jgi:nitroreductase
MNESVKTPASATPLDPEAQAAMAARYGAVESNVPAVWNETIDVLLKHRSVRGFLSDPLPAGTVETLVAAGQSASSSSNVQAWTVIAVENADTKAKLAVIAGNQKHMIECPVLLVWCADLGRTKRMGQRHSYPTDATEFLESFVVSMVDAALAAQNATVAAESLGLGMVYIGALRNNPEAVAEILKLPDHVVAAFGMCVGKPDPARPFHVKPRLPQRVVLHREQYDHSLPQEALDSYDTTLSAFQRSENMKEIGWTGAMKVRWRDAKSINGRDRIRLALTKLGFKLD